MTSSRRTRRNINKEAMFAKIMPSYTSSTYNEYYGNETRQKSDPDTFKIREKVLSAMEDRPLVPDPLRSGSVSQPVTNAQYQNPQFVQNQPQMQNRGYNEYQNVQQPQMLNNPQMAFAASPVVQQPAQQPQYAPAAPVDDDKPRYINITEEVLYSKLANMIAMFKCCSCEKCRQTIMLQVLNNVKPEYVYKKPSEVKELIESSNYVDINQPIIRAILDTKSNPPHKK